MLAMIFAILMIISASLGFLVKIAESIEDDNRLLELSLESADMYSAALEERGMKIRRLRHDTLGLLQAIESAAPGEESTGRYISNMPLLDAIICLKEKQCKENGITFDIRIKNGSCAGIKESDLCLLIQNLLENAYEENLRIEGKSNRWMKLDLNSDNAVMDVVVSNSLSNNERISFFTQKSNPELHGIGTRVIDEIIKKYDGHKIVKQDAEELFISIQFSHE